MARIACLIGRVEGKALTCLGLGEGNDIQKLLEQRSKLIAGSGLVKQGKDEVRLTELRLIANATSGGELKGAFRWPSSQAVTDLKDRESERAALLKAKVVKAQPVVQPVAKPVAKAKA